MARDCLFILCAEGIYSLIRQADRRGDLHGIRICTDAPVISHFLFANDCFLFLRAEGREAYVMKNILATYEDASRQAISLPKSKVYYGNRVEASQRDFITNTLGVRAIMGTGKYIGLL